MGIVGIGRKGWGHGELSWEERTVGKVPTQGLGESAHSERGTGLIGSLETGEGARFLNMGQSNGKCQGAEPHRGNEGR